MYKFILIIIFTALSFTTYSQTEVYINQLSSSIQIQQSFDLQFGSLYRGSGDSINVLISDTRTSWVKITAPKQLSLSITISKPTTLNLGTSHLPVNIKYAYTNAANVNSGNLSTIKNSAVETSLGHIEIPVSNNPASGGGNKITSDVYLFFYGTAGPVLYDVLSGVHSNVILISITLIE